MTRLYIGLVFLLLRFTHVLGYMIDDDCGDDTAFLREKIDSAFRLLARGVTELNKTPVDPNVDSLFDSLFGRSISQTPDNHVLRRMTRLAAISAHNPVDQTTADADIYENGLTDVRFYCTWKRVKKNGPKEYLNTERDNLKYRSDDNMDRFSKCYDLNPPTLAVTMTWSGKYSEIQICPWFLRKSRDFKLSDLSSFAKQPFVAALSKMVIPVAAKSQYTDLDVFILMDKTIAHELLHTDQASLKDYFSCNDFSKDPYGWKNARKLAEIYRNEPVVLKDPMKNADSNSLFALGAYIVTDTGNAITQDGKFTKPQGNPKGRRELRRSEWQVGRPRVISK